MVRKHTSRLIVLAVMLAACEGATPPDQVAPKRVVGDPHTVCSNGQEVVLAVDSRGDQTLRGDIDGDGLDDRVWISSDASGAPPCKDLVGVETKDEIYWAAANVSDVPSSLQAPRLNSLADVDGDGSREIVIDLEAGASTQFVGVLKLTRAGLERMSVDGEGPGRIGGSEGLFAYGGSVGHLEAVDCTPNGFVVISVALPVGAAADAYEVERRFFSSTNTSFVLEKGLTEKHTVEGLKVDDFPEFAGSPFGSCG